MLESLDTASKSTTVRLSLIPLDFASSYCKLTNPILVLSSKPSRNSGAFSIANFSVLVPPFRFLFPAYSFYISIIISHFHLLLNLKFSYFISIENFGKLIILIVEKLFTFFSLIQLNKFH
jgi:hypothetical protein